MNFKFFWLFCGHVGGGGEGLVGVEALLVGGVGVHLSVGTGDADVGVVNPGQEDYVLAVDVGRPFVGGGVEVEAGLGAVGIGDGIAFGVGLDEVNLTVLALDFLGAVGKGVAAAPELDAVDDEDVGESRDFVYGENPEGDEDEFVDEFVADGSVPGE